MTLYGMPSLGITAVTVSIYIFITRFYVDTIKISLTTVGAVILASRIWDAVIDPTIGMLSDRTNTKFGRRRVWLMGSSIPFLIAILTIFSPPIWLSINQTHWWFALSIMLFFFTLSTLQIPYEALGAELSEDYTERNRLFAIRQAFYILGTILAAVLPLILARIFSFSDQSQDQRALFNWLGICFCVLCFIPLVLLIRALKNIERPTPNILSSENFLQKIAAAFKSKSFRILLIAYILSGFGAALPATLIEFYVRYVLHENS